jgi:hypothetical protein
MFSSDLREKEQREVWINDTEAEPFRIFISYIYSGILTLNASNVLQLFHLSDKYALGRLRKSCSAFMARIIRPDTVLTILPAAQLFGCLEFNSRDSKCIARCYTVIDMHTSAILDSFEFVSLSVALATHLLERSTINIKVLPIYSRKLKSF